MLACERKHCPVRARYWRCVRTGHACDLFYSQDVLRDYAVSQRQLSAGGMNNGGRAARAPKKMISVSARRVATWQSSVAELCYACSLQGGLLRYARTYGSMLLRKHRLNAFGKEHALGP